MAKELQLIPLTSLALVFILPLIVIGIFLFWSLSWKTAIYALFRMALQLLAIGYFLTFIFETERNYVVLLVLGVMLFMASWIALRPVRGSRRARYSKALGAISIGGVFALVLVTQGVLRADPWYRPDVMIPLAGMIFAMAMNCVSLAAERFEMEIAGGKSCREARPAALNAALIPHVNSLFAVGLVSLPGMMTGQILAGADPFIAVRYQVVVMCMLFGTAGISAACYLAWQGEEDSPQEAKGSEGAKAAS